MKNDDLKKKKDVYEALKLYSLMYKIFSII